MNEPSNLSRRDWFRLRVPRPNKSLGVDEAIVGKNALKPIAHPPNHDGLDLTQLPPMREAVLSHEQIRQLFKDVGELATDVVLMQKPKSGSSRATANRAEVRERLQLAEAALLGGSVPRLQIRYRWQDSLWIDTLTSIGNGFKLVRIAHQGLNPFNQ